jgi:DNA polymerase-3 subunit delta
MPVSAEQLPALTARSLAPVYIVAGAEPLLVQECRDCIIKAAQKQGFVERSVFDVIGKFDWKQIEENAAELSLFSSRKIMDVRMPTGKPGNDGAAALLKLVEEINPDILLLVSCGEWSKAQGNTKWAKGLAQAGVLVEIWPIKPHQLPQWIRKRMLAAGLKPEPEAIAMLADLVEGNLLAAQQEIDKLLLLEQGPKVTVADITRAVSNSTRFDAFRLVECALQGRLDECLRVASGLQRIGVAIQPVCGALYKELVVADTVRLAVQSGQSESSVFGKLRVWPARQAIVGQTARRLSEYHFGEAYRALAMIDQQSKGRAQGDPWQTLDQLLCLLCAPGTIALSQAG